MKTREVSGPMSPYLLIFTGVLFLFKMKMQLQLFTFLNPLNTGLDLEIKMCSSVEFKTDLKIFALRFIFTFIKMHVLHIDSFYKSERIFYV